MRFLYALHTCNREYFHEAYPKLLCHRSQGKNGLSDCPILWYYYDEWIVFKLQRVCDSKETAVSSQFTELRAQICDIVTERSDGMVIPRQKCAKEFHLTHLDHSEQLVKDMYDENLQKFSDYIGKIKLN